MTFKYTKETKIPLKETQFFINPIFYPISSPFNRDQSSSLCLSLIIQVTISKPMLKCFLHPSLLYPNPIFSAYFLTFHPIELLCSAIVTKPFNPNYLYNGRYSVSIQTSISPSNKQTNTTKPSCEIQFNNIATPSSDSISSISY